MDLPIEDVSRLLLKWFYDAMRGVIVTVQVADAFAVEVARSQTATSGRGQIATVMKMEMLMMVLMVSVTYGQSAWCEP